MNNDEDDLDTYVNDAKTARRGAVLSREGKTRITMYLDNAVLDHFREVATAKGRGYQTEINDYLVAAVDHGRREAGPLRVVVNEYVRVRTNQRWQVRETSVARCGGQAGSNTVARRA